MINIIIMVNIAMMTNIIKTMTAPLDAPMMKVMSEFTLALSVVPAVGNLEMIINIIKSRLVTESV